MRAQKPVTSAQQLIQEHRYADAAAMQANDSPGYLHRGEPSNSSAASTTQSRL
jgi:hypothetical protein